MRNTIKNFWPQVRGSLAYIAIFVSGALFCWLVFRMNSSKFLHVLVNANLFYLFLSFLLVCLLPFLITFRWRGIFKVNTPEKKKSMSYSKSLQAVFLSSVLNSFLPSKSGDFIKVAYIRQYMSVASGAGTVVLERIIDLFTLCLLVIIGSLWCGDMIGAYLGLSLITIIIFFFLFLTFLPLKKINGLLKVLLDFRLILFLWCKNRRAVLQTILCSLGVWITAASVFCCIIKSIDINLSLSILLSVFPIGILAGMLPFTVSGIGTRDAAFVFLLQQYLTVEQSTFISIGYTFFVYWLLSFISFPFVFLEIKRIWLSGKMP